MKRILIVGATSAVAEALARRFAARGDAIALLARSEDRLDAVAGDLRLRGAAEVTTGVLDVLDASRLLPALNNAVASIGGLDVAVLAHGTLSDQAQCEVDIAALRREMEINLLSTLELLSHLGNQLAHQGHGCIVTISSVAGDRGRASNYVYGTAKGGLTVFLQGLRHRLARAGVQVLTVKPGFVDTPMTAGFRKGPLWASPEAVAADIDKAMMSGRDVIYTPWFWRYIMLAIRVIPDPVFKRLPL